MNKLNTAQVTFQGWVRGNVGTDRTATLDGRQIFADWKTNEPPRGEIVKPLFREGDDESDIAILALRKISDLFGQDVTPGDPPVTVLEGRPGEPMGWGIARLRFLHALGVNEPVQPQDRSAELPESGVHVIGQVFGLTLIESIDAPQKGQASHMAYKVGVPPAKPRVGIAT